jgi:alpha-beta hydrolase superfamily lysophospholipase
MNTRLLLSTLLLAPTLAAAQTPDAASRSTVLLDHLDAGEFTAAEAMFDERMRAAVPESKLQAVWSSLPPAGDRGKTRVATQGGMQVCRTTLHRGVTQWTATVAVDPDGRIGGLLVAPWHEIQPPPAVPADASYDEREITVGEGERALPGTLALPKQQPAHGVPAVVLVQGSGPTDRNETVAANRPFLDIARGLAAQGIATLRYDKRSFARPQEFSGNYTVDDETTDDAVAAVALLRRTPGIDPKRVFVLGHSQGGMLAPRIANRAGKDNVAGLVLLAAPARSLLDIIPEQNRYLAMLDGTVSKDDQAMLDGIAAEIALVRDGKPHPGALALGAPLSYWRGFDRIDPVADARGTHLPMLLLQGGRDIQVVDTDWQAWRKAFAHERQATFHHYPSLNHLGIAGSGPGTPMEYERPGHVDTQLITDIADWINHR